MFDINKANSVQQVDRRQEGRRLLKRGYFVTKFTEGENGLFPVKASNCLC